MNLPQWIERFFNTIHSRPEVSVTMTLGSGYDADRAVDRTTDVQLTENFGLFELTVTANAGLQALNRKLSDAQVEKLTRLARHAEGIRRVCGGPVRVNSGYRSLALNGLTTGSSSTSQHPKCEALDFTVIGKDLEDSFVLLRAEAAAGRFVFGQLIIEEARRDYGVVRWLHCSLIGTLNPEKVGQVLRMVNGAYELIEQIKFEPLTL